MFICLFVDLFNYCRSLSFWLGFAVGLGFRHSAFGFLLVLYKFAAGFCSLFLSVFLVDFCWIVCCYLRLDLSQGFVQVVDDCCWIY